MCTHKYPSRDNRLERLKMRLEQMFILLQINLVVTKIMFIFASVNNHKQKRYEISN